MRLVIVTGMSGSGKQTAMKLLEDAGYYCVDNLPVPLVPTFAELIVQPGSEIEKAAVGLDIRSDQAFGDIMKALSQLTERGIAYEVLFMDADDSTLLKRYKESRRMHPIDGNGAIEESILKERSILKEIRDKADYVIDTSSLLTRELKEELEVVVGLVERCVAENARVALDQDEYTQRYNGLVSRYEAVKAQYDEVTQTVADKADRKKLLEQFLHTVEGQAPVTEFDERLWSSLVDFVTVYSEKGIRVTFKDGTEIQV